MRLLLNVLWSKIQSCLSSTGLTVGRIALLWINKKVSYNHSARNFKSNQPTPKGRRKTHLIRLPISGNRVSFSFSDVNWTFLQIEKSLEITIWFTPSLIGNAIAISFIGIILGPLYPIVMNYASYILPRRILTGSIGWIAGFGSAGIALVPFMAGAITSKKGIQSLQPLWVFFFFFQVQFATFIRETEN